QPELELARSCDGSQGSCAGEARQYRGDVEDQDHRTVTQNGGAADQITGDDFARERFDDQLFFTDKAVYNKAEALFGGADDDDEIAFFLFGIRGFDRVNLAEAFQANQGEDLLAESKDFALIDAMDFGVGDTGDFDDRRERHGKEAATDSEQ